MPFVDPVSATARLTAAARARETRRPDRLFEDPWAAALAGPEGFAFMNEMEASASPPGNRDLKDNPYIAIRTRYFDELLLAAVRDGGAQAPSSGSAPRPIRQVVIVAAGLDTRAFRLEWPAETRCYELDRADVLHAKDELLQAAGAVPRCGRHVIGTDLTGAWAPMLTAGGFDPNAPSAWLIEGLTPYIEEKAVRGLLAQCAALAAAGSRLGLDAINRGFFESPWTGGYLDALKRVGAPWIFGTDEPEVLLDQAGWNATVVRPGEPAANFGRWPYPLAPRDMRGIPSSFLVTATRR